MEEDYDDSRQPNKSRLHSSSNTSPFAILLSSSATVLSSQLPGIRIIYVHTCNGADSMLPYQTIGWAVLISRLDRKFRRLPNIA